MRSRTERWSLLVWVWHLSWYLLALKPCCTVPQSAWHQFTELPSFRTNPQVNKTPSKPLFHGVNIDRYIQHCGTWFTSSLNSFSYQVNKCFLLLKAVWMNGTWNKDIACFTYNYLENQEKCYMKCSLNRTCLFINIMVLVYHGIFTARFMMSMKDLSHLSLFSIKYHFRVCLITLKPLVVSMMLLTDGPVEMVFIYPEKYIKWSNANISSHISQPLLHFSLESSTLQ